MDFVPWRLCRTILAELADNTALGQVDPRWFHQAQGIGGMEGMLAKAILMTLATFSRSSTLA